MKPILAAILLFAFLLQSFCQGLIVLDYYANIASYQMKCENKNNPKMHCCGKCQLRKKLHKEESDDKQNPDQRGENKSFSVISSKSFFATGLPLMVQEHKAAYPQLSFPKDIKMPHSFFHPPGA